jgi:hypothetical protein
VEDGAIGTVTAIRIAYACWVMRAGPATTGGPTPRAPAAAR